MVGSRPSIWANENDHHTCVGIFIEIAVAVTAADSDRFVQQIQLPSGQTVVVAEGDFEPRSIGSYSVRLYAAGDPQFPTDEFRAGVIHPRDGVIEKIMLADIDEDGDQDLVVVVRCAGSGGYLSAHAFSIGETGPSLLAAVAGVEPGTDPLSALTKR